MDRRIQAGLGLASLFALGALAAAGDAARDRAQHVAAAPDAALSTSVSAPATEREAFDFAAMTPAERGAFGAAVRAYLMEHPQVLVEAIEVLETRSAAAEAHGERALIEVNASAIFDDGHSWVGGNPQGDLTLVEFIDYRCGFCARAKPDVEELVEEDGGIRLVVKEFPILGPESVLASQFAVAVHQLAGDDAYKAAHDALFALRGPVTQATLTRIAGDIGVEADAVLARMDAEEIDAILHDNRALAERLRISGTPTFVLGGQMLRGYLPLEEMQAAVEQERS